MPTKDHARQIIAELVEKYSTQIDTFQNPEYNETQTRLDFINPFFEALGWDIDNKNQKKESERDVIVEENVRIEGRSKYPDYTFRQNGRRLFFVEAKKPSLYLKESAISALQVKSYSWNVGLPISLLTNFAEFAIYDCTQSPKKTHTAANKRLKYIQFKDYLKEFDFLWETFAYENVLQNSLQKYAESKIDFKNEEIVSDTFLRALESWRNKLAENLLKNQILDEEDLNFAVQQNIDRVVFIRVCEDRGVEELGRLEKINQSKKNIFYKLLDYFKEADLKYNSGLFNFKSDQVSQQLKTDDQIWQEILTELEELNCNFKLIPIEILGYAYEQFLGKVIRLDKNTVIIEEKPEVRKAGGVYYTPEYIVNYMLENTLGKLIADKTPEEVAKIKVLDPSCGSGSFLLGAYDYLLNWHLNFYKKNKKKYSQKENPLTSYGQLTSQEKKRILLNNIFGVDIDSQAVEVSKLSLLLKALENETPASVKNSLVMLKERVLPNIDNNILCGNSLIENDFYENGLFLTRKEERKINAFDWKTAFPTVFEQGGFDIIIGNPPYVRIQNLAKYAIDYFSRYKTAQGNFDIYCLFVEKGMNLLNSEGKLSVILPHRFFKTDYGMSLRDFFVKNGFLDVIFDFDGYYVFRGASINTCIIQINKKSTSDYISYYRLRKHKTLEEDLRKMMKNIPEYASQIEFGLVPKSTLSTNYWNFIFDKELDLFNKLSENKRLGDLELHILVGLQTSSDTVYIMKFLQEHEKYVEVVSKHTQKIYFLEKEMLFPLLRGAEVKRFGKPLHTDLIIFPYKIQNNKAVLIEEELLQKNYPNIWAYLNECKPKLLERDRGKQSYAWYAFGRNQNLNLFNKNKIMTTVLSGHNSFTLDREAKFYFVGGGNAGVYGIQVEDENLYLYLLGLLNSKLLNWFHKKISLRCYQTAYSYGKRFIEQLPIKTLDFSDKIQKAQHDKMIMLVETMIELQKRLQEATLPTEIRQLEGRIKRIDQDIDNLVYQLYGLNDSEIALIEENA